MHTEKKKDIIEEYYSGNNADYYEDKRRTNPKWQFENDVLNSVIKEFKSEITCIIDAPVGTGRFLDAYKAFKSKMNIYGIDYSADMLKVAAEKSDLHNISFIEQDIINKKLNITADLSVCYRFLNLINFKDAAKTLSNLLLSTQKFSLFAIRTIEDDYMGETFIENKIYLHKRKYIERVINEKNFEILKRFEYPDKREGQYTILLCRKVNNNHMILSSRINKNLNLIYTYGDNEPKGKIYQVKDNNHAKFIENISKREEIRKYFPKINSIQNEYVDSEWVKGELVESSDWLSVINLLSEIQNLNFSEESSFDYVEDLMLPRFYLTYPVTGIDLYNKIVEIIKEESERYTPKISHPDIIPGNVVNCEGVYRIIDNELLCYTIYHRIDIFNLLYNLEPENRLPVFNKYLKLTRLSINDLISEQKFLQALWLARQVGSFIRKEKPQSAIIVINSYMKGENILPVDICEFKSEQQRLQSSLEKPSPDSIAIK